MSNEDALGWTPDGLLIFDPDTLRAAGITLVPAREVTEMSKFERWVIHGLLICRRTPEGPVPVRVLLPDEVNLVRSVMDQHPALTWEEAVTAIIEAPP